MTSGEGRGSDAELVVGKKFAEGGQAELFEVQIKWNDPELREFDQENKCEWVLKVFKKGTFLRDLQSQWPQGMLQFQADILKCQKHALSQLLRFHCGVYCGTSLEDGRFTFVLMKEDNNLHSMIDQRNLTSPKDKGPFSKDDVELMMYDIAHGINQLHGRGIVHRDIKASNVFFSKGVCYIAGCECSIGGVGTGFFRALEILEACKYEIVNEKVEIFTKAVDVYRYGMSCYQILTDQLPFEGHRCSEYDFVLEGQRPKLPKDVDDWICKLLIGCWECDLLARPSFGEILMVLVANSTCSERKVLERREVELGIRNDWGMDSKMIKLRRLLRMVKLKMMGRIGRNPSS